ncbi:MAG TPA: hypothetical protein VN915_07295 [Elusimicrobiota bacterium]|nr:hypothetical protein [Elusimicrobiota bacterium]
MRAFLPLIFLATLAACQKDPIEVRVEPKEDAAAAALAPASRPRGVRWTAPSGWTEAPGTGMRVTTLTPPQTAGKAEVTVIALPGDVGGELANVNRWRGQLALPPIGEADLPNARAAVRSELGAINLYDFTGTGANKTRLVAGMFQVSGTTWFFKLMGDEKAVAAARPAFLKLLEGLQKDAS